MKVIVLGAGIIGVTTAYFLAREGHKVTVIDKNSASALGCSNANGCQLSYSHIETWSSKNSLASLAKAALIPGSFLTITNFTDPKFFKWLYEFVKNSSEIKSIKNSRRLFLLAAYSRKALQDILSEEKDIKFSYSKKGILHFFRSTKKFDHAIKQLELNEKLQIDSQILSPEECVKKEPTLIKSFDDKNLSGGILYNKDESGDCFEFTRSLERICAEKYGVEFEYDCEVKNIFTNHKKITGVNTSKGVLSANKYVYCLGAAGTKLLRGVGIDSKIYPIRGYSLSIKADDDFIAPKIALTDNENKIVYSRIGNIFRAAGTIEISGFKNKKNNEDNINFLKNTAKSTFSDFGNFNEISTWSQARPFRPNSIPLICEIEKYGNLFINSGHGSLGWTLSAASAKIISDIICDKKNPDFDFLKEEEKYL